MSDKERVIKGLECCIGSDNGDCPIDCPFYDECFSISGSNPFVPALRAALQVLKAQPEENEEETRTHHDIRLMLRDHVIGFCPECKEICIKAVNPRFCGSCGQEVKWDE